MNDDFTDWLVNREECIMDLDEEELKATRRLNGTAELTADEMFENLGYKKQDGDDCWLEYYKNSYEITKIIEFELNEQYIFVQTNQGDSMPISLKELKAINKKVKELGWI